MHQDNAAILTIKTPLISKVKKTQGGHWGYQNIETKRDIPQSWDSDI